MNTLKSTLLKCSIEKDGVLRLTCAQAFVIAQDLDVKLSEIGRICNEENIRICSCQLGCFK